jgi:thiamine biosynthesis lipoprotein
MAVASRPHPRLHEARRHAMGTDAHVLVVTGDGADPQRLLAAAWARVDELEARWSRFLPTSEVTALNAHAGTPVVVSADTVGLVERAMAAWELTGGRFDPTVGAALVAQGYDRDLAEVLRGPAPAGDPALRPAPGLAGAWCDDGLRGRPAPEAPGAEAPPRPAAGRRGRDGDRDQAAPPMGAVYLPAGVSFDPGGIGKGLAADLVVGSLLGAGAAGALVNLGGDLRAAGEPPAAEGWAVTVPDPLRPGGELARIALPHGAVATTSRLERRWRTRAGEAHHLIDPATGRPAATDTVAVTVVAAEAWWAEAFAKALFLAGPAGLADLAGHGSLHAIVVTADGRRHATAALQATLR